MRIKHIGDQKQTYCFSQLLKLWLLYSCHLIVVLSQCENVFEGTCVWTHNEKSALRWLFKSDGQERYAELSKCEYPNCGTGILQSPWLQSRNENSWVSFQYKIYGTSDVYLRLYLVQEDNTQQMLFSKTGDYAFTFPETWSSKPVALPPIHNKHKLILKAFIPYKEAYVAVKDITLDGSIIITSTNPATAEPEMEEKIPEDGYDYKNEIDPEEQEEGEDEEDHFQLLEINHFIGEDDLKKGYTTVVEPDICRYK
ncbi:uncharacterized protein LOC118203790 isoform X2 [Stegodyphus dumicola]|uniref:uncharacterized protein LOC118203790 isoform X2 n=1 Tax=Stegodyphus dumicola TaxID=202533 RepID=UPI0015A97E18|nr:uncharacterized protein LOC118203790 isoform X2 [Stegodyphus dumicola]